MDNIAILTGNLRIEKINIAFLEHFKVFPKTYIYVILNNKWMTQGSTQGHEK